MSQDMEGWAISARPFVIGALAFAGVMIGGVAAGGAFYKARFTSQTRPYITLHQHPALETLDIAPSDKAQLPPPEPPRAVGRAMAEVAAQGDAVWGQGR